MPSRRCATALLTAALAWIGGAAPAQGAEDELIVALEPGYDRLSHPDGSQHGLGGTASVWLGLSDDLWLALSGGGFHVGDAPQHDALSRWEAFGGIVAALDVFRVVPYVEAMAGIVGGPSGLHPTARLGVGADYLLTPELSLGAVLRYRPLPAEDLADAAVTAQARLAWRLEW